MQGGHIPSKFPLDGPNTERLPDGSLRPIDKASGRPLMSETEANWHAHVSGMEARRLAEAGGSSTAFRDLVSSAAAIATGPRVGELTLQPLNLGILEVLTMLGSAYAQPNPERVSIAVSLREVTRSALAFAKPEWVFDRLSAGDRAAIDAAVSSLSFAIDKPALKRINDWIEHQMHDFFSEEAEGKKPLSGEESPEVPRPAQALPETPPAP